MTARPVIGASTTAAPQVASEAEELAREKQQAADSAVAYVQSGMVVGLGAGSTAILATRRIGQLLREGRLSIKEVEILFDGSTTQMNTRALISAALQ